MKDWDDSRCGGFLFSLLLNIWVYSSRHHRAQVNIIVWFFLVTISRLFETADKECV
jgi:hypothetical protein